MANIKKQRALLVLGLLLVLLGGFALFVHTCVAIHITPSGHGECISISFFEKYTPENVDKIVIEAQGQKVVITDPTLIRESGLCVSFQRAGCEIERLARGESNLKRKGMRYAGPKDRGAVLVSG